MQDWQTLLTCETDGLWESRTPSASSASGCSVLAGTSVPVVLSQQVLCEVQRQARYTRTVVKAYSEVVARHSNRARELHVCLRAMIVRAPGNKVKPGCRSTWCSSFATRPTCARR